MAVDFLGTAGTARGKVNMIALTVAFILSVMVIRMRSVCISTDATTFKKDSLTQSMYVVSIFVIVACILLFGYDMFVMFK
jgi:hypothetical protein